MNPEPINQETAQSGEQVSRILDVTMKAGRLLLENGSEIPHVEKTMKRIAGAYGVRHASFFVLSNGIFTTGWDAGNQMPGSFAKVAHIPLKGMRLDRIVAMNQLTHEACRGTCTVDELETKIDTIRTMPAKPIWQQLLAAAIGSGCFSVLFGGSLNDALVSAIAGLIVWLFVLYVANPHLSKITTNLFGSAFVTLICVLLSHLGMGDSLGQMIIGGVITLIPGVALTNGVRDIADGDYIAGIVRLLDACLGFFCIGVGVGLIFILYTQITGGILS